MTKKSIFTILISCVVLVAAMCCTFILMPPKSSADDSGADDGAKVESGGELPGNVSAEMEVVDMNRQDIIDSRTEEEKISGYLEVIKDKYDFLLRTATNGYNNPRYERKLQMHTHLTVSEYKKECEINKKWYALALDKYEKFEAEVNNGKYKTLDEVINAWRPIEDDINFKRGNEVYAALGKW